MASRLRIFVQYLFPIPLYMLLNVEQISWDDQNCNFTCPEILNKIDRKNL